MSVTGPAQSAVDWVNPVNSGPWGPLAETQGWPQVCHVGGRRRSNAGDQTHGDAAREGYGFRVRGVSGGVAGRVRRGSASRVQRRWPEGLERAGASASSSPAARCFGRATGTVERREIGQSKGRGEAYVHARARWALAKDQTVTGTTPATC